MYESFFRLSQRPFASAPNPDAYIATGPLEQARQTLERSIDRAEGPGLIVGPAGMGKSLLCLVLARHFRSRFHVAHLAGGRLGTRRALLQNILFELKLPYRNMDEGELRLSLIDHLEPRGGGSEGVLLLVDEASALPLRLLEEIRLLTNVVRDGQSRIRLVLAGGMALEERLANPKLESFHQRIAARCYLQPLARAETLAYVQEQISRCGARADQLFTAEAQQAVHTASDGIPRLINQLCDHALLLAALGGHRQIDAARIDEAWADLQQLPVPLADPPVLVGAGSGSARGIVEFGPLDEFAGAAGPRPAVAGSMSPGLASITAANLEAISRSLESLERGLPEAGVVTGTAADDFCPVAAGETEIELIFHAPHDPFGGQWEEEEVVIDRYASLEDAAVRSRRVTSDTGRALGEAVAAASRGKEEAPSGRKETPSGGSLDEPFVSPPSRPRDGGPEEDAPATIAAQADFHPASDPLLPDEAPLVLPARRPTVSLRAIGQDDRDMIVVDDERPPPTPPVAARKRRPEYRQLFSTLRSK